MEQKDIEMIGNLIRSEFEKFEKKFEKNFNKKLDEKLDEKLDKILDEKLDKILDKKLDKLLDEKLDKLLDEKLEPRFKEQEDKFIKIIEKTILDQMFVFEEQYGRSLTLAVEAYNYNREDEKIQNKRIDTLEEKNQINSAYVFNHEKRISNLENTLHKIKEK